MFFFQSDAAAKSGIRVLVLGNSLTAGYGLKKADAFPIKLETALRKMGWKISITNAGVSGDTTAGGLSRLNWALSENPHLVLVELGANDGLRGLDPIETRRNLNAILVNLQKKNIKVLLAGMLAPPNLGKQYSNKFNGIYAELSVLHKIKLYQFFLEGVANRPHLNQADGIHPNAKGVDEIVRRILPSVITLLKSIKCSNCS
ncbi:MAG: arylesterase [Pseudomonadota bacterium]|nr:arylesterase [Pseudomonadota bacterium]